MVYKMIALCSLFLQMLMAMRSSAMRVHSSLALTITTLADATTCVRECYQNSFQAITSASTPSLQIYTSVPHAHTAVSFPLRRSPIAPRPGFASPLSLLVFSPPPIPSDALIPFTIFVSSLQRLLLFFTLALLPSAAVAFLILLHFLCNIIQNVILWYL